MKGSHRYKIKVRPRTRLMFTPQRLKGADIVFSVQTPEGVDIPFAKYQSIPEAYDRVLREIKKYHTPHSEHDLPEYKVWSGAKHP